MKKLLLVTAALLVAIPAVQAETATEIVNRGETLGQTWMNGQYVPCPVSSSDPYCRPVDPGTQAILIANDQRVQKAKEQQAQIAKETKQRVEAENAKSAADAAAAAAYRHSPEGIRRGIEDIILEIYKKYAIVAYCHAVRQGYLVSYINDDELARAQAITTTIVDKAVARDTTINTDRLWEAAQAAVSDPGTKVIIEGSGVGYCQMIKNQLFNMSPFPVYPIAKPR